MSLLYKEDWDETKARFRAWWAGENFGRCGLAVTAPRKHSPALPEPARPPTPDERWMNLDYVSALAEYGNASAFYGGEAFPVWSPGYPGHMSFGTWLGCRITLDFETGWIDPILTGEDIDWRGLRIDEQNLYWQFTLRWLRRAAADAKGKSIPPVGAFGGCGDTLAWLRGTDRLLYDVIDRAGQVRDAEERLMDLWFQAYDTFYNIVKDAAEGSTCWFGLWSPGKFYAAQNDFSYMISPKMLRDIFLPVIERQTRFLDHSVYHVDGIGAFAHVDALCDLPRLQAIQILPGAGKPSPLHYMPVLKKVQARRKNLHISIPCEEVESALSELSARGLFISTSCPTEDEARELLRKAERWSVDRR